MDRHQGKKGQNYLLVAGIGSGLMQGPAPAKNNNCKVSIYAKNAI